MTISNFLNQVMLLIRKRHILLASFISKATSTTILNYNRKTTTKCDQLRENQPLSILFKNAVAAHKGSLVDNTVHGQKKLITELKSPLF